MTPGAAKLAARIEAALANGSGRLDLSGLGLKTLPALPAELLEICELDLGRNRLTSIAGEIFAMSRLERLDLGGNRLTELQPDIARLDRLAWLDLSENHIERVPAGLFACPELRELSLHDNSLESLAFDGVRNENLRRLDLSRNRLTSLADLSASLPVLRELDVSGNRLQRVDLGLAGLGSLRILDLSDNELTSAEALDLMPRLEELSLDDNQLVDIPPEIASFPGLRVFSAAGNPFGALPAVFERVGASALRRRARLAFAEHVSGGGETGKEYFIAPHLYFDFALALGGVAAVVRFVDIYFKWSRGALGTTATLKFPDGSVISLANLSRKTALDLVRQHENSLARGKAAIEMGPIAKGHEGGVYDLLAKTVASVPSAEVVGKKSGDTYITLINSAIVQSFQTKVTEMGDNINIDRTSGVINLKSKLDNVTQTIGASGADEAAKTQLVALMKQLSEALAKVPDAQKLDAEAVADAAQEVVGKATKPNPNKKSVDISAKGLLEAAKGLVDVIPIATGIVQAVGHMMGL